MLCVFFCVGELVTLALRLARKLLCFFQARLFFHEARVRWCELPQKEGCARKKGMAATGYCCFDTTAPTVPLVACRTYVTYRGRVFF